MKKILLSLVTLFAVGTMTAGASQAVFSSSASITGNDVTTGTLDVTVTHSAGKPWQVTNLKPGNYTEWENMTVRNAGSLAATYYFYLDNAAGNSYLWNNLQIELRDGVSTGSLIYNGPVAALYGIANKHITFYANRPDGTPWWQPGNSQGIYQRLYLPSSVTNDGQGVTVSFDEMIFADQNPYTP